MPFDDDVVDTGGVDDRRGRGGRGGAIAVGGGGLGLVGLILFVVISALGGGSGLDLSGIGAAPAAPGGAAGETRTGLAARCNTDAAIERYDDCYLVKVYNEVNEVWSDELSRRDMSYDRPSLGFYEQAVQTGCGTASSQVGPFYCPADREIYIDLGFLAELQQRFGAPGRYAQAYILAHEAGHHLQTLLGTESKIRLAQRSQPARAGELSVAMELQADCYAGVYGRLAGDRGNQTITSAELDQALNAAAAVGDDRIQAQTQGRVDPESFSHGTSAQRRQWFQTGYRSGDLADCDSFVG